MKKYLKLLFFIIVPFGWLLYILFNKKLRTIFIGKVTKFFRTFRFEDKDKTSLM